MSGKPRLHLHAFLPASRANGPGVRAVLWTQGCTLGCPGCFNPETHGGGGEALSVESVLARLTDLGDSIEGVTLSGGEPLQQWDATLAVLQAIRARTGLSTLVFTGFGWEEIQRRPDADAFLACVDVLLAGRYEADRRVATGLLGSSNKTIHFLTARYSAADLDTVPEAEIVISASGDIVLTGIDPVRT